MASLSSMKYDRSPLKALDGTGPDRGGPVEGAENRLGATPKELSFPTEIEEIDHWITFRAFESSQLSRTEPSEKKPKAFIRLPIPSNLATAYQIGYTEADIGAIGSTLVDALRGEGSDRALGIALLEGAGAGALVGGVLGGGIKGIISGALAGAVGATAIESITGNRAASNLLASEAIGQAGAIGARVAGLAGIARNPHKVVLFESVGFRTHQFSYIFVPQSREESVLLRDVIGMFKYFAAPSFNVAEKDIFTLRDVKVSVGGSAGKHFFKYPEYFEMDFHHPEFLFQIGPSVLTSVEVKYSESVPSFARDQPAPAGIPAPTQITLTLSFKEVEIVTKENILSENR